MNIACFSFYADEILIQNPFVNANNMRKEFSPIENPRQYRNETIKNLFFLFLIIPWIEIGLINFFPDPWNFNHALMMTVMEAAEKRRDAIPYDEKSFKEMEGLLFEDYKRTIFTMPDENLRSFIRNASKDLSEEDISKVIEYSKKMNAKDPLVDLNPGMPGKESSQMRIMRMTPNIEMSMFLAQATGSMIITDNSFRWSEICSSIPYYYGLGKNPWEQFETFVSGRPVQFPLIIEQKAQMHKFMESEFMSVKKVLKRLWNAIIAVQEPSGLQISRLQKDFVSAQELMSKSIENLLRKGLEFDDSLPYPGPMNVDAKLNCKISPIGHINNLVYRLLVSYAGHDKYLKSLPLSLYVEYGNKEKD